MHVTAIKIAGKIYEQARYQTEIQVITSTEHEYLVEIYDLCLPYVKDQLITVEGREFKITSVEDVVTSQGAFPMYRRKVIVKPQ
jgi:hypothetical protein